MTRKAVAAIVMAIGLGWQGGAAAQDRYPQTLQNYQAVINGTKQLGELSPQELADIAELDRRIRAQKPDTRTPSQRCVDDEIKRAGGTASQLERRVIDMKCREVGD